MAQFPGEFFINHDEQVRFIAFKRKFEDFTSKEKLEFCIWIQSNFDDLIAYARSTQ